MRLWTWAVGGLVLVALSGCTCVGNLASSVHSTLYNLTHPFSSSACCPSGSVGAGVEPTPFTPPPVYENGGTSAPEVAPLPQQ